MEFNMGTYNKRNGEQQDFGSYTSEEDALNDLLNHDIPKGNYGVIEGSDSVDGEYKTKSQVMRALKKLKRTH